jgi:hypothetical protein
VFSISGKNLRHALQMQYLAAFWPTLPAYVRRKLL